MGLFSAKVQYELVPLFLCQFFTFPLFLLAVVCQCFTDLLGLVSVPPVIPLLISGLVLDALFVVLLLKILRCRYRRCRCLSGIVLEPPDSVDRYRYCFRRCPRVGLGYLPIPNSS